MPSLEFNSVGSEESCVDLELREDQKQYYDVGCSPWPHFVRGTGMRDVRESRVKLD